MKTLRTPGMTMILGALAATLLSAKCAAQPVQVEEEKTENQNVYTLDDGGIRFVAPEGFRPLSKEVIATKWPTDRAPQFAVGNESASTTIAYDLKPNPITVDQLPELLKTFEQGFERMIPGLEWEQKEVRMIDERKWVYIEMTSNAVDTDIYNVMMVTPYKGAMLIFNFNSTREEFPELEKELREAIESIEVSEEKPRQ